MKFTKGIIVGGLITAGLLLMYNDGQLENKKMMKKGKQIAKKIGIM